MNTPCTPTAELQQQEHERRREAMPRVLRSYATAFDRGSVSDSDAGLYVRRAADEIESLRAALLAARREVEAMRTALEAIANLRPYRDPAYPHIHIYELPSIARAALAATQEER